MSDTEDFEEQLRQEAIQKAKEEEGDGKTYKDKDGVEYEWDAQKKAWFPKIDEDFIARYQMNYGIASTESDSTATASETTESASQQGPATSAYDNDAYNQYYNYYNSCYVTAGQTGDSTTTTASTDGGKPLASPGTSESENLPERTEEYKEYCKEYYKFYHGNSNEDENFDYCTYYEYYSQYGYTEAEGDSAKTSAKEGSSSQSNPNENGEKRKREEASWFEMDQQKNTNVYVSGLAPEVTDEEFIEFMGKCGMVMHDPFTRKPKIKLYKDEAGKNKGDGRCCYIKVESVDLALKILDGSEYKGQTVHVEKANFSMKGNYDPKLRKKLSNKQKKKLKLQQQKLFDWRPDELPGERKKSDKVVVLKNVFDPVEFEKDPAAIQEIRSDMRLECSKYGDVRKVTVYDRHPEGVATVAFKEPEEADVCLESLNGRWFAGRQLSAETWDGKTKYDVKESEKEREARLQKWEKFLQAGEGTTSTEEKKEKENDVKEEEVKKEETGGVKMQPDAKGDEVEIEQDKRPMEVDDAAGASS